MPERRIFGNIPFWRRPTHDQAEQPQISVNEELRRLVATTPELGENERIPKGSLGMTAEDHAAIGSTPPDILVANPGSTRAAVMSDGEILDNLRQEVSLIRVLSAPDNPNPDFARSALQVRKQLLHDNLAYLKHTNLLPQIPQA